MAAPDSRLVLMETSLNPGGGSERTSQDHFIRHMSPAGSAEEAYDRREKLHLGFDFHIVGDLTGLKDGRTTS